MSQSEGKLRIDYVEIPVSDLAEAKRFYGEVFGWSFKDHGTDYASFDDGRIRGGLWTQGKPRSGGILVVLYSPDLEGTRRTVVEAGGKVLEEIFQFPGGRRFYLSDPAGNELAVWSDR